MLYFIIADYKRISRSIISTQIVWRISLDAALCLIKPYMDEETFSFAEVELRGFARIGDEISALDFRDFVYNRTDFS